AAGLLDVVRDVIRGIERSGEPSDRRRRKAHARVDVDALDLLAPDVHEHLIDRGDRTGRAGGELGWWARRLPRHQIAVRAVERRIQDGRDRHAVGDDVFEIELELIDAE